MTFEIKFKQVSKSGKVFEENFLATEVEEGTRDGLDAIKALPEGKNRFKWFEIPNDYQMSKYFESWELTVLEATTGKTVYKKTR